MSRIPSDPDPAANPTLVPEVEGNTSATDVAPAARDGGGTVAFGVELSSPLSLPELTVDTEAPSHAGPTMLPPALEPVEFGDFAVSAAEPAGSDSGIEESIGVQGAPRPGQVLFGRYRVESQLGEGGMGTVWLIRHLELNAFRALKLIISGIAFDRDARARFRREARVMALLSHPNAVVVHDARMAQDAAFIEMEYIRGQSLNKILKPGVPMPLDWVARILEQLCDVLQAAHDTRIVHRDLKPANMMLVEGRPAGREFLKVLDFGIAKILEADSTASEVHTQAGSFMGSAPYSSPEQCSGGDVDARSDLYSVGIILYEFLTGARPFSGPLSRVLYDQLYTPPPPFAEKNPQNQVPAEVERVVARCLAKKPEDRPQSARALFEEFSAALGTAVHSAAPPAPTEDGAHVPYRAVDQARTEQDHGAVVVAAPVESDTVGDEKRPSRPMWQKAALGLPVAAALALGLVALVPTRPGSRLPDGYKADASGDLVRGADGARFARIAGGEFAMGNSGFDPSGSNADDDQPAHPVILSDYYLQETEVTNGELEAYFKANHVPVEKRPKRWRAACEALEKEGRNTARYPAVGIPHDLAEEYARSVGGQLPTEAQWEFAARSRGKPIAFVWGMDRKPALKYANIDSIGVIGQIPTSEVGKFPKDKTEQGVVDLMGNVREWCRDVWAEYSASETPRRDPEGPPRPASGTPVFVIRGGSFATWADKGTSTRPRRPDPDDLTAKDLAEDGTAADLGFRVAIEGPKSP